MLIGPGKGLVPIDFVFFRSRVKDTRVTFVVKGFRSLSWDPFYHRAFICIVLIVLNTDKILIDFGLSMSTVKVTMVTLNKNTNMVFAHYL